MSGNVLPGGEPGSHDDEPASQDLLERAEKVIPLKLAEVGFSDDGGFYEAVLSVPGELDRIILMNYPAGMRNGELSTAIRVRSGDPKWPRGGGIIYSFLDIGEFVGWRTVRKPLSEYEVYMYLDQEQGAEGLEGQALADYLCKIRDENLQEDEEAQQASGDAILKTRQALDLIADIERGVRVEE
jgi:hypothetical protein